MQSELIKEYNVKEILDLAKNYKQCKVTDLNGKTVYQWNGGKKQIPIEAHVKECIKRVNSTITPEGYYYFCFSHAPRFNKDAHTKYLFRKGTPPQPLNDMNEQHQTNKNDLLSVTSALNYITQIAELKTELNRVTMENTALKDENAVLNAELEEVEREEGLSAGKGSDVIEYLKETAPALMSLADRYFLHQDKKLDLEQQKINAGINTTQENKPRVKRTVKIFETGSPEHLNFIRLLYSQNNEAELNKELDKLEALNEELFTNICNELNLFENEATNEN